MTGSQSNTGYRSTTTKHRAIRGDGRSTGMAEIFFLEGEGNRVAEIIEVPRVGNGISVPLRWGLIIRGDASPDELVGWCPAPELRTGS